MLQTSKTYLTLVNNTLDEAGADLASFAPDGSDFTTQTDPMLNRFKKWVNRAWTDIQQASFDWEWMSEQAIVTVNPGVMFYSDTPIVNLVTNIAPICIKNTDGSVAVDNLTVSSVQSLSGAYTQQKNYGYLDIAYTDYTPTNNHTLDFNIKPGNQFITKSNSVNKAGFRITLVQSTPFTSAPYQVGTAVNSVSAGTSALDAVTYPLTKGVVSALTFATLTVAPSLFRYVATIDVQYTTLDVAFWDKLKASAALGVPPLREDFGVYFSFVGSSGDSMWHIDSTIQAPSSGVDRPACSISPLDYTVVITGNIGNGDIVSPTASSFSFNSTATSLEYTGTASIAVVAQNSNPSTGSITLHVTNDAGYSVGIGAAYGLSLYTTLLLYNSSIEATDLSALSLYKSKDPHDGGPTVASVAAFPSGGPLAWTLTMAELYGYINTVHSWKSFSWDEETGVADFVENIREVNDNTFKLINPDVATGSANTVLPFIPWSTFINRYDYAGATPGTPTVVTEDNTGRWRFYPPINKPYTITFNYVRNPLDLVAFDDVPKGLPDEYADMIMWKALQYYGEYDEQPSVASRGKRNYQNLLSRFEQVARPKFYFKPKVLW